MPANRACASTGERRRRRTCANSPCTSPRSSVSTRRSAFSAPYHVELLDRFGGQAASDARDAVGAAHIRARRAKRALDLLHGDERKALERYEDARFACHEIEAAAPEAGEDVQLNERRRYLDNVERIAAALRTAHEALAGDEGSAANSLGVASVALASIGEMSGELREMAAQASALQSETAELSALLGRQIDSADFDPAELETINARLDVLERLKRKYGGTIESVVASAGQARAIVEEYEARGERTAELNAEMLASRRALEDAAAILTKVRRSASARLVEAVKRELQDLALASGRFGVDFAPLVEIGHDGAESAEFTFAANIGEPMRPLARVASGGELSRVLLALVVALADAREPTATIFDEIDAGIGGATAVAVGIRLGRLGERYQIVCVTHLAQLATWAERHYVLEKREADGTTTISVRELDGDEARARELARMLSGEEHDVALEHARALLRQTVDAR